MADDLRARKKCFGNSSGMENGKPGWWLVRPRRPHHFLFRSRQADQTGSLSGRIPTGHISSTETSFVPPNKNGTYIKMLIDEWHTSSHHRVGDVGSMPWNENDQSSSNATCHNVQYYSSPYHIQTCRPVLRSRWSVLYHQLITRGICKGPAAVKRRRRAYPSTDVISLTLG